MKTLQKVMSFGHPPLVFSRANQDVNHQGEGWGEFSTRSTPDVDSVGRSPSLGGSSPPATSCRALQGMGVKVNRAPLSREVTLGSCMTILQKSREGREKSRPPHPRLKFGSRDSPSFAGTLQLFASVRKCLVSFNSGFSPFACFPFQVPSFKELMLKGMPKT